MLPIWGGIALLILLLTALSGAWSGVLICSLVLSVAMVQCGMNSTLEILPVLLISWSIPISAYLAALLIERHCLLPRATRSSITTLTLALAMSIWLANPDFPTWLSTAQHAVQAGIGLDRILELSAVAVATTAFCAGVIAFVVIATIVVIEFSAATALRSVRYAKAPSLQSLRPAFMLVLSAISLYLVTGFLSRELSPLSLLRSVRALYG